MKYRTNSPAISGDHAIIGKLSNGLRGTSQRPRSLIIAFFYSILFFFVGVFAFLPKILFRIKLGERTIGVLTLFSVYGLIWIVNIFYAAFPYFYSEVLEKVGSNETLFKRFLLLSAMISNSDGEMTWMLIFTDYLEDFGTILITPMLKWLWYIIFVAGALQLLEIWSRKDEPIHSYYRGDSVFFGFLQGKQLWGFKITKVVIWMFIEPIVIVLLSFVLVWLSGDVLLGHILKISAAALFVEEWRFYSENRGLLLDIADSNIDSQYIESLQTNTFQNASKAVIGRAKVL